MLSPSNIFVFMEATEMTFRLLRDKEGCSSARSLGASCTELDYRSGIEARSAVLLLPGSPKLILADVEQAKKLDSVFNLRLSSRR